MTRLWYQLVFVVLAASASGAILGVAVWMLASREMSSAESLGVFADLTVAIGTGFLAVKTWQMAKVADEGMGAEVAPVLRLQQWYPTRVLERDPQDEREWNLSEKASDVQLFIKNLGKGVAVDVCLTLSAGGWSSSTFHYAHQHEQVAVLDRHGNELGRPGLFNMASNGGLILAPNADAQLFVWIPEDFDFNQSMEVLISCKDIRNRQHDVRVKLTYDAEAKIHTTSHSAT
jgi:hypothetical protein